MPHRKILVKENACSSDTLLLRLRIFEIFQSAFPEFHFLAFPLPGLNFDCASAAIFVLLSLTYSAVAGLFLFR